MGRLPKVRDVTLATFDEEIRMEAILDTGSTHCMIPRLQATLLGFSSENRLGGSFRGLGVESRLGAGIVGFGAGWVLTTPYA